jgi:hypothetical protein
MFFRQRRLSSRWFPFKSFEMYGCETPVMRATVVCLYKIDGDEEEVG